MTFFLTIVSSIRYKICLQEMEASVLKEQEQVVSH